MRIQPLIIVCPKYCACCWRPITTKNKMGRLETYCAIHKPEGGTKRDYMKSRRAIDKVFIRELNLTKRSKVGWDNKGKVEHLVSAFALDPKTLSVNNIATARTLIKELLSITSSHYNRTFERIKELGEYIEQRNLTINLILLATHVALGSKKEAQARAEVDVYDTKKESSVWFTQLLFTVARFESFAIIEERALIRQTRNDKDFKLREAIRKAIYLATNSNKKPNQTAIAKDLNVSKQRIGKVIKEMYPAQKGYRKYYK